MGKQRHRAEEVVAKLRQVDVLTAQGGMMAEAIRQIGVTEVTYYRGRSEYWRAQIRPGQADEGTGDGERPTAASRLGPDPGEADLGRGRLGTRRAASAKLLSPARRRACVEHVITKYGVSERLACRVLGQPRSTQRKIPKQSGDEAALTADIIALATRYGRYGYWRITTLLRDVGWLVNKKRVERIWRRERLKVPTRQPKKSRL